MKIIYLEKDHVDYIDNLVLALGQFDGLHLAHRIILNKTTSLSKELNLKSGIVTFDPHPDFVIKKDADKSYITPLSTKIKELEEIGLDYCIIIKFNLDVAGMDPKSFVEEYLVKMGAKEVVCGFDFSYGKFGKGKAKDITSDSGDIIHTTIIDEVKYNDEKMGSSMIRTLLKEGKIQEVNYLLGHPYYVVGTIVHGSGIGHTLGFPTANINVSDDFVMLKPGVYGCNIILDKVLYKGICNFGFNPTLNNQFKPRLEVFIFDFNGNLYDHQVKVELLDFVRPEIKFDSKEELINQISSDIKKVLGK